MAPQPKDSGEHSPDNFQRADIKIHSDESVISSTELEDGASATESVYLLGSKTRNDESETNDQEPSFFSYFLSSSGPPQVAAIVLIIAIAYGCTIGVVPAAMTDRFAKLRHGFPMDQSCSESHHHPACTEGSADAQNASAYANLVSNTLTLFTSSMIGSFSDVYGRRIVLILGIFLSTLSPMILVFTLISPTMSPWWYYVASASSGLINWMAVCLSAIADILPPRLRAPGVGLFMASFWMGLSASPSLAILLGPFQISMVSWMFTLIALAFAFFCFRETLSPETAREAKIREEEEWSSSAFANQNDFHALVWTAGKPIRALSILNRSDFFRKVSLLAFFSGMANAGDQSLLIYYVEDHLSFTMSDVAVLFLLIGGVGVFVQSVLIKPLNDLVGERYILAICFTVAAINNTMYGLATRKATVFVAITLGALAGMAFPTISAIKANNVHECEQGRIQGALYSIQAIAYGVGPMLMRYVDHLAKDSIFGSGSMFLFAGALQLAAVSFSLALPKDKTNSKHQPGPLEATEDLRDPSSGAKVACYDAISEL